MYVSIYIYLSLSLALYRSLSLYIYTYICTINAFQLQKSTPLSSIHSIILTQQGCRETRPGHGNIRGQTRKMWETPPPHPTITPTSITTHQHPAPTSTHPTRIPTEYQLKPMAYQQGTLLVALWYSVGILLVSYRYYVDIFSVFIFCLYLVHIYIVSVRFIYL